MSHATQPPTCPAWCAEDHTGPDRTHWGTAHGVPSADPTLTVGATLRQDPDGRPVVSLDFGHDTLTPDGARAYAELLVELADQLAPLVAAVYAAGPEVVRDFRAAADDAIDVLACSTGQPRAWAAAHADLEPVAAGILSDLANRGRPALGATVQLSDRVNVGAPFRSGPVVGYGTVTPEHFPVPVDMPAYPVVLVSGPDSVAAWSLDRLDGAR